MKKKKKGTGADGAGNNDKNYRKIDSQTIEENHLTDLVLGRINEDLPEGFATAQLQSSSDLIKLRQIAQDRIIDEMIA